MALAARRIDRLEAVAAEIGKTGRRAVVISCDVTRDGDLERAVERARAAFGKLDVVVANAGFGVSGTLERLSLDDYRRQLETNVFGVLRTIYATLDDLKKTRGRLVLIGSVSGHVGVPGSSAYSMSKFAVHGLAAALGHELAPYGVAVTLDQPGFRRIGDPSGRQPGCVARRCARAPDSRHRSSWRRRPRREKS